MKRRHILFAAILASTALTMPAQTSQKITAGKANEYGLIYSLPVTALDIYIEAEVTECHPGEFYNYARRYLGIKGCHNRRKSLGSCDRCGNYTSRYGRSRP